MPEDTYDDENEEDEINELDDDEVEGNKIIWTKSSDFARIFGNNIFKNFEMADIEEMIKKFMEEFDFVGKKPGTKGPIVWGFSMTMGPDKKPIFRQFGDLKPKMKEKIIKKTEYDPLIDVIDDLSEITVIAEIPGVSNSDIKVNSTPKKLRITVDTTQLKFYKEILLPSEVVPKTATARYKNGILEIKLQKKGFVEEGTTIPVN
ncbi:MAG: archaeal heat shock protein Hsp20 [Candidatus Helarchaeota archaeon]